MNKKNYVIHYGNLLGMKLKKIHRILKFKEATNQADNNAAYGKTMENMRKRIEKKNKKNSQDFIKYTSRPTYIN